MGFILTELVIETILRDGLAAIRESIGTENDMIDIIFAEMLQPYLAHYYGAAEIAKIKTLVKNPIEISQGYPVDDIKVPYIGINLQGANEAQPLALLDDFGGEEDTRVDAQVLIGPFDADSYDPLTGMINVTTANPNLSTIHVNSVWVDGGGKAYQVVGGIRNEDGNKTFAIQSEINPAPNLVGTNFVSIINTQVRKVRNVKESETVLLLIGSENALATKYIFTIVKYIFLSQRTQRIMRGLDISTYDGTDFSRADRLPDNWFTRFMNIRTAVLTHTWTEPPVDQIGDVNTIIQVPEDQYPLPNQDDLTVQTEHETACSHDD